MLKAASSLGSRMFSCGSQLLCLERRRKKKVTHNQLHRFIRHFSLSPLPKREERKEEKKEIRRGRVTCFPFFFLPLPPPVPSSPSGGSDFISITVESFSSRSQGCEWQLLLRRCGRVAATTCSCAGRKTILLPPQQKDERQVCVCLDACQQSNRTLFAPKN